MLKKLLFFKSFWSFRFRLEIRMAELFEIKFVIVNYKYHIYDFMKVLIQLDWYRLNLEYN